MGAKFSKVALLKLKYLRWLGRKSFGKSHFIGYFGDEGSSGAFDACIHIRETLG